MDQKNYEEAVRDYEAAWKIDESRGTSIFVSSFSFSRLFLLLGFPCQDTQNYVKGPDKRFRNSMRGECGCARARACVCLRALVRSLT